MFNPEDKVIVPEPTPERVYQCALYLQKHSGGILRTDFKKAMAMPEICSDSSGKIFDTTYGVLKELGLCSEVDGKIWPSDALKKIKNANDFRRYCARFVFQFEDSLFFNVTQMYCEYAEELMAMRKWDDVNVFMGQRGLEFHPNVLKGWRLWAPFLGCGYLNDYFMIPNWARRISDLLDTQTEFRMNEDIPISKFMFWLTSQAPEVKNSIQGTRIGLGVSNGLKTLNDLGELRVIHMPDADLWQLSDNSRLSHVRIVR